MELARPLFEHSGTYGEQAGRLAFVDSAVRCDLAGIEVREVRRTLNLTVFHSLVGFLGIYSQPEISSATQNIQQSHMLSCVSALFSVFLSFYFV